MNRRDALRNLGLSFGYVVATPTVLSLLNSCNTAPELWTPIFLSPSQGLVMKNLVNLIIPKTEKLPGAVELHVVEFIDLFVSKTYDPEKQNKFKTGFDAVLDELGVIDENSAREITTEQYDAILSKYLRANKTEIIAFEKDAKSAKVLKTLVDLRDTTQWAYKNTEEVGEKILDYNPIPGKLYGCMTIDEVAKERGKS